MRVLAVSGSLPSASTDSAALRAAARLAPRGVEVDLYGVFAALPLFDPDLDGASPPAACLATAMRANLPAAAPESRDRCVPSSCSPSSGPARPQP